MGLLHLANRGVSKATRLIGGVLHAHSLPAWFNGRFVWLPSDAWTALVTRYEPYNALCLRGLLRKGDFFLDVGAHWGVWSLYAAKLVGRRGLVVACEPSPAFQTLEHAARSYPQVRPIKVGLGAEETETVFFAQGGSSSGSFVKEVTAINQHFSPDVPIAEEKVPIKPLDKLLEGIGRDPAVVKIDVEGFELEVLRGALGLLTRRAVTAFVIEVHPRQLRLSGGSEGKLITLLAEHGYHTRVIDRNPNTIYTVVAEKALTASLVSVRD